MYMLSKAIFFVTFFIAISCSSIKRDNIEYIIYGVYTGECFEHCATMYKLEKDRLYVDTTDSFFKNDNNVRFSDHVLGDEEFEKALIVKNQLPELLLKSNVEEFGSPDGHDQGGIFIEIKSGATIKRFYIDTVLDRIPKELRGYAKLIMKMRGFTSL
ncbi:MAG: hypothetical protein JWP69_1164 [Flaviaesturariibacter sp.]|nr:hypothetical protein [Flaviaesturariibacter sp.]